MDPASARGLERGLGLGSCVGFGEIVELRCIGSAFPLIILWKVHSVATERNYYIIILLKLITRVLSKPTGIKETVNTEEGR